MLMRGINTVLGDGTAAKPYQIRTAAQLAALATVVNAGANQAGVYYVQTADLDLSGYANWTPIGTSTAAFNGVFNGNGFSIYNLVATGARVGLFGYINGGTLKNINIQSGTLTGISTGSVVAGVCAHNTASSSSTISGCVNRASIVGVTTSGFCYLGGIVGYHGSSNAIINCANFGTVTQNSTTAGTRLAGGIIGERQAFEQQTFGNKITTCFNAGAVTGNGKINAISGASPTLSNCYFDNQTSSAGQTGATGRATANCQGTDALTDANKLSGLGTSNWFARVGNYPLPIRFQR